MSGLLEDPNNYGANTFNVTTPPPQWQSGPGHYLFEDRNGGIGSREEFFSLIPLSGSQDFDLELTGHDNDVIFEIVEIFWIFGSPGVGGYEEAIEPLFTTTLTGDGTTSYSFTLETPTYFIVRASTVGGFDDYLSATSQLILLPGGGTSTTNVFWSNRLKTTEVLL